MRLSIHPSVVACSLLTVSALAGCDASESPADVGEAPGPLVFSEHDGQPQIEAPQGEFNEFSIFASYDAEGCGLVEHVYGVLGPSGVRVEDCPECLLPGTVVIGEPIPGFDMFACVPSLGIEPCEDTSDVTGLSLADLAGPIYLCGEEVKPSSFSIQYAHLDTTEPEAPRTWITVTAEFLIGEDGVPETLVDWERCVEDSDGFSCDGPTGSGTW